jgi:hypothetical protein
MIKLRHIAKEVKAKKICSESSLEKHTKLFFGIDKRMDKELTI